MPASKETFSELIFPSLGVGYSDVKRGGLTTR
nr:MAG TPA: hypothetical protein [Caudoviricetes sp.]